MPDSDHPATAGAAVLTPDAPRPPAAPPGASGPVGLCRRIADHGAFQSFILAVIVLNAVVIGLETSAALVATFRPWFNAASLLAQAIFTVEIAIRITAFAPHPLRFFRHGWNTFDFVVVALAFVPASGGLSNVGRLARVARATRLVSALPELRLVFETMVRSMPSMAHILTLLGLFLYVYGILGFRLYAGTDPERWGSLGAALLTLFQILTLEGWNEIQGALLDAHPWSWLFFASFIVVAVWVVTNLFVAVIINNLEAAKQEATARFDREVPGSPFARIAEIRRALAELERDVRAGEEEIRDRHRDPSA